MEKAKNKKPGRRILSIALAVVLMGLLQVMPGAERTAYAADDITVTIDTGDSVTLQDTDSDGYYEIGTEDELYAFAAAVNGGNTSINGKLTANIVVNESLEGSTRGWTPIGNSSNNFTGQFDGGGHTVKGLVASADYYAGFFGVIYNGEIKNVGVIDSAISGGKPSGGVCGQNSYGTIADCYFTGTVSGWGSQIGGIVGMNYGGTVTGCYNAGTVTSSISSVGGICGICKSSAKITNCYNTGTISGSTAIGGICGEGVAGTIANCYNTGTVSGNSDVWKICSTALNTVNCYYLDSSETDSVNGTTYKTEADFKSGAVCWLLNGSTASADSVWGQNVGIDTWPGLNGNIVYSHTLNSKTFYSNGKTAASKTDDVYMIDSADKLRWFIDAVNYADLTADAKLTADIDLTGRAWNCMNTYAGTFDGDGHTISGMSKNAGMADGNRYGLIRTLSSGGKVTKLTILSADLWSNKQGTGAIAEKNEGVISECIVKNSTLQYGAGNTLGGIVGINAGTITDCGVIGCNMLRRWSGVGNDALGYVADTNNGTVSNCYSYGCTSKNASAVYAIVASGNDPINCYYYTTSAVADTVATAKTAEAFASGEVAYLLNGSTSTGTLVWGQTLENDDYPVFKTEANLVCASNDGSQYSNHNVFENGLCTCCGGYEKAAESENGVYQISNAGELLWFAEYVNNGEKNANAVLTNDIDMTNVKWTTICETELYHEQYGSDDGYVGTFDGQGHVIKNLTVTSSTSRDASVGLFGTVSGTIKNLGMVGFNLVDGGWDMRAGAIVGQLIKTGKVSNCYVMDSSIETGTHVAGGIAGCVYDGTVENCYTVNVTVTGHVDGNDTRYGCVTGDACADGNSADGTDRPGTVKNCYTNGSTLTSTQKGADSVDGGEAGVSTDRFESGEVAYLLNGSTSTGTLAWYQTLSDNETDDYPVLNSTHETVYQIKKYDCPNDEAEVLYSNTEGDIRKTEHSLVDGKCTICGIELFITLNDGSAFVDGEYTFVNNVHTINTARPVTITGTTEKETVVIASGVNANITLNGVSIYVGHTIDACAFKIEDNSTGNVTITLADGSTNILRSGMYCAGLQKNGESGGTLTICGGTNGTGILDAAGGSDGSGIGGDALKPGSKIIISGGIVSAKGGYGGAGIGGGHAGAGTGIIISGGSVKVTAGTDANAIGGGIGMDATTPTLEDKTTPVYLLEIDNDESEDIVINGTDYPDKHGTEAKIYAYLPAGTDAKPNEIKVGETVKRYYYDAESGSWVETCGNHVDDDNTDGVCDTCGKGMHGVSLAGHDLVLGERIAVNFHFELDEAVDFTGAYVELSMDGGETKQIAVTYTEGIANSEYTYEVAAKEMNQTITARFCDAQDNLLLKTDYSVAKYAQSVIGGNYNPSDKDMVTAMLTYGKFAEAYFSEGSAEGAGDLPAVAEILTALENSHELSKSETSFIRYAGSSLILLSNTTMRIYFELMNGTDIGDVTFTWDENKLSPEEYGKGNKTYYYVDVEGITPKNLDAEITITAKESESKTTYETTLTPLYYVKEMLDGGTEDAALINLLRALYAYYGVAAEYKNQ